MQASKTVQALGLGPQSLLIHDLFLDSRAVTPGSLFFAYPGAKADGREFIAQAVARGAVAIAYEAGDGFRVKAEATPEVLWLPVENLQARVGEVAARFYEHPTSALRVIGVTGTNGKTSITHFVAQALHHAGRRSAVLGTIGNGVWPTLAASLHTTEDPITLQKTLAEFRAMGVTDVAMEVSSHALAQGRMTGTVVDTAVFTQLSRDHLDYHGTMEAYAAAKARLFVHPGLQHAVINLDDPWGQQYLANLPANVRAITYSMEGRIYPNTAYVNAARIETTDTGYQIALDSSLGAGELHCALVGKFNIANLLATLGVLLAGGSELQPALEALSHVLPVQGRMQLLGGGECPRVVVDYAHTPDALEKALLALKAHCRGQLWCVFGCGGDRDRGKRPLMAAVAARLADRVVITNDNPRTEDPQDIAAEILAGVHDQTRLQVLLDRREAIRWAVQNADRHDMVLIAGKGHEKTQTIGQHTLPFDDAFEVQLALERTGETQQDNPHDVPC